MQATQPLRTVAPLKVAFAGLAAAAIVAAAAIAASLVPSIASGSADDAPAAGPIEVRRTLNDLYGPASNGGAIEVRRTPEDLYGPAAPLALDQDARGQAQGHAAGPNVPR